MQLSVTNGLCEGRNLGGIVCVAEVHLNPKLLSDTAWVVTCLCYITSAATHTCTQCERFYATAKAIQVLFNSRV